MAHLLEVTGADKEPEPPKTNENGHRSARNAPDGKSTAKKSNAVERQRKEDVKKITELIPNGEQRTFHADTFNHCAPEVASQIAKHLKSITCNLGDNNAHCEYGDSHVHVSRKTNTWGNNRSTLLHECGHAVLNGQGQLSGESVQGKFKPIVEAAVRETEAWALAQFGDKWRSKCLPSKGYWYKEIGIRIFDIDPNISNGEYYKLENEIRSIHGNVSDIMNAGTRGVQFMGHGRAYFQRQGEARPLHEIVANVTSIISIPEAREKVIKVFPDTIRAVEKIVYGIES